MASLGMRSGEGGHAHPNGTSPLQSSRMNTRGDADMKDWWCWPQLLPAWMTTVLLTVLLAFLSAKLITRGVRTYQAETRELQAAVVDQPSNGGGGGGGDATSGLSGGEGACSWPRIAPGASLL